MSAPSSCSAAAGDPGDEFPELGRGRGCPSRRARHETLIATCDRGRSRSVSRGATFGYLFSTEMAAALAIPSNGSQTTAWEARENEMIGRGLSTDGSPDLEGKTHMCRRGRTASRESETTFDLATVIDDDYAFRTWYDMTAPRVYAYLYSRTGSAS